MRAYNEDSAIYEEYSLKEILEWLCSEARKKGKMTDLQGADLRGSDLRGSDLRWTDLQGADLRGSDLRGSDLRWTDLQGSDLRWTDLRGTDFDFSVLNLSCYGIGLNFDERVIKQLMNHALKQNNHCEVYEEIKQAFLDNPKWINWLESWHRSGEVDHLEKFVEVKK